VSRKKRDLSEDEEALWRRVARGVKPRRPAEAKTLERTAEAASPTIVYSTKPKAKAEAPPVKPRAVAPKTPPADRSAEKRVRRGKLDIDATLDLHGFTQDGAFAALAAFLHSAQRRGGRVALVVTGVGRAGEGVLKKRLPDWLAGRELKPLISGYAQAHRSHGGAGAFYVFLKRPSS